MFIYVVIKGAYGATFIDKWICNCKCDACKFRFLCYTTQWQTFRGKDDYGIFIHDDHFSVKDIKLGKNLNYCCRLVLGKKWDKESNSYVPEVINGGIC